MKTKKRIKIALIVAASVVALVIIAVVVLNIYENAQMSKIPAMSFEECLQYTTAGGERRIIKEGQAFRFSSEEEHIYRNLTHHPISFTSFFVVC